MQLNSLKRKTPRKMKKLVGRGGAKGKTSGRGTKGQKAHGGHGIRPEMRDTIKKFPKMRGRGKNINTSRLDYAQIVNIKSLEEVFDNGATINAESLFAAKLIRKNNGKMPSVKILAVGDSKKKFTIEGCEMSASAKKKLEEAGSTIK